MQKKETIGTLGRLKLFKDDEGFGVEPIDPRKDLAMTLRFFRWAVGVLFWFAGWIASRRELEEQVLVQVVARARRDGRITLN